MFNLLTIIGARPQIIKSIAISRAIKERFGNTFKEYILHTGQHYDEKMSAVFFEELGISQPDYNLNVGGGSHAYQTGEMMKGIEKVLAERPFDAMIVYGDTNSTIAGALVAAKANVPVVHVEAGLRSFDRRMPEELNRIATDQISSLLFSPTETGLENLVKEGFREGVRQPDFKNGKDRRAFHCGDIMYDNSLYFSDKAESDKKAWFESLGLQPDYVLATVHRAENTDNADVLRDIMEAIVSLSEDMQVVMPLHPRTSNAIKNLLSEELRQKIYNSPGLKVTEPLSFLQITMLEKHSKMIVTDSGGVQKEAYYFHKPSIVLREDTEWIENVRLGASALVGHDMTRIKAAFKHFKQHTPDFPYIYGDGHAAEFILEKMKDWLEN